MTTALLTFCRVFEANRAGQVAGSRSGFRPFDEDAGVAAGAETRALRQLPARFDAECPLRFPGGQIGDLRVCPDGSDRQRMDNALATTATRQPRNDAHRAVSSLDLPLTNPVSGIFEAVNRTRGGRAARCAEQRRRSPGNGILSLSLASNLHKISESLLGLHAG
jgi:hypothetical protein